MRGVFCVSACQLKHALVHYQGFPIRVEQDVYYCVFITRT